MKTMNLIIDELDATEESKELARTFLESCLRSAIKNPDQIRAEQRNTLLNWGNDEVSINVWFVHDWEECPDVQNKLLLYDPNPDLKKYCICFVTKENPGFKWWNEKSKELDELLLKHFYKEKTESTEPLHRIEVLERFVLLSSPVLKCFFNRALQSFDIVRKALPPCQKIFFEFLEQVDLTKYCKADLILTENLSLMIKYSKGDGVTPRISCAFDVVFHGDHIAYNLMSPSQRSQSVENLDIDETTLEIKEILGNYFRKG